MKVGIVKLPASVAALFAAAFTVSAQVPSGPPPPTAPIPADLNPEGPQYSLPNGGQAVTVGEELFASGGPVYVTQLGPTGADYTESLFVASPTTPYGLFLNNHGTPNGTTYFLGDFAAGTEIEFGLDITVGIQNIWYDGPGSRNADGDVHAYMLNDYEGLANTTYVGFEDLPGSIADFNYTDEIYAFTGVAASVNPPAVPDASATAGLLGLGLAGVAALQRRFRK